MIRLRMEQLGSVFGSRVLHLEFVKVTARSSSSTRCTALPSSTTSTDFTATGFLSASGPP
ncbi:MAG: hypothetical protein VCA38_15870 [Roseibacillus sp.]